jgi:hypothetical protein
MLPLRERFFNFFSGLIDSDVSRIFDVLLDLELVPKVVEGKDSPQRRRAAKR